MEKPSLLPVSHLEKNFMPLFEVLKVLKAYKIPNKSTLFFKISLIKALHLSILTISSSLLSTHMLDFIEQLHRISSYNNLELSPEKPFGILLAVSCLGHEFAKILMNQSPLNLKVNKLSLKLSDSLVQ